MRKRAVSNNIINTPKSVRHHAFCLNIGEKHKNMRFKILYFYPLLCLYFTIVSIICNRLRVPNPNYYNGILYR